MQVKYVMTQPAVVIASSAVCLTAAELMRDRATGALVVLNDQRKIEGIVTDRDLVVKCIAAGLDPTRTAISECCHFDPITAGPDQDVRPALVHMLDAGVRRLPVVSDDDEVVGMLALDDVATDFKDYVDTFADAVGRYRKSG